MELAMNTSVVEKRTSNLVVPNGWYELNREEMSYVEGGGAFPVALISVPINILLCLNPYIGIGFGGLVGLAKFGFKSAAKKALKPILKGVLGLLGATIGAIYAGAGTAIRSLTNDKLDQVVSIAFNCLGGLGSIIAMLPDAVDGRIDGWCRW